jgi:hypothetical protein
MVFALSGPGPLGQASRPAYNLENLWRVADEPAATAGEGRRTAGQNAGYYWLLLAEGHLTRRFGAMLGRIALLPTG